MAFETDRTAILTYQRCPRERWLSRHAGGRGLQKKSKGLPLQFGSAFHEGTEVILSFHRDIGGDGKPIAMDNVLEIAVMKGNNFLRNQFETHSISFDNETPDDIQKAMEYGQEEQMALAEGLLRGWWAYEGKQFLNTFEVVEVEQEGRANLSDDLVLMYRPDAVVQEKATGDNYIVSWKTASTFSPRNLKQAKIDMQSLSEVFGVIQQRGIKIEGVLYKYAVKGQRRRDSWDGLYKQSSHLIYGWIKLDTLKTDFPEWSWSYEWEKEDGSGSSRLGKGWKKVPIWRDYPGGVKQWIEDLSKGDVFPRHIDALQAVFPQSLPVERRKDEVESWVRQTVAQETKINAALEYIGDTSPPQDTLDVLFPQYTHSCSSYSGCSFQSICWEGAAAEPGELYQIRISNHPEKSEDE